MVIKDFYICKSQLRALEELPWEDPACFYCWCFELQISFSITLILTTFEYFLKFKVIKIFFFLNLGVIISINPSTVGWGRLMQEDFEFEATLGYILSSRPCCETLSQRNPKCSGPDTPLFLMLLRFHFWNSLACQC
jgi:hypothetical protein